MKIIPIHKQLSLQTFLSICVYDLEKDLYELFLRRVRGFEFAREAMGKG